MALVAELAGVTVKRGDAILLDDVHLWVDESERWVVIGPNGAGKTTLLQVLAAQLYPSAGVVGLLGDVVGAIDVFELRPRIGFTSSAVAERIPAGESVLNAVVSASYAVLGRWNESYEPMDLAQARRLLGLMRIEHMADRTFGTLSEGERKRVQIARALMTDPELLLLDEPAGGLDLAGRESLVSILSEVCLDEKSPATILVTHHLEEIPEGITHALLLSHGHVVAAGPIAQTLTDQWLSAAFEMPLTVEQVNDRWTARSVARHG
ncbi:MAG: ABC transporter ATP-binding protein [Arachnia sp.]